MLLLGLGLTGQPLSSPPFVPPDSQDAWGHGQPPRAARCHSDRLTLAPPLLVLVVGSPDGLLLNPHVCRGDTEGGCSSAALCPGQPVRVSMALSPANVSLSNTSTRYYCLPFSNLQDPLWIFSAV